MMWTAIWGAGFLLVTALLAYRLRQSTLRHGVGWPRTLLYCAVLGLGSWLTVAILLMVMIEEIITDKKTDSYGKN